MRWGQKDPKFSRRHKWRPPYLKEDTGELWVVHADGGEVRVSDEGVALPEGEGVSHKEEWQSAWNGSKHISRDVLNKIFIELWVGIDIFEQESWFSSLLL